MNSKRFEFWRKWLLWVNIIFLLSGIVIAVAGDSILLEMHNQGTRDVFFQGMPIPEQALNLKKWLFGIIGATIVGFHVLAIFIIQNAFIRKEKWAWYALWGGLLSWFFIDSGISALFDAWYNILQINLLTLILIGLPLVFTSKSFFSHPD